MSRLPELPKSTDSGHIYVVKRNDTYKIGFSRRNVQRRARAADGQLLFTIPTSQRPSVLERLIHQRFAGKRAQGPVFKREWFSLTDDDLVWLRGLAQHVQSD